MLELLRQSLGNGGNSLLSNKALLAKTQFPRECFPLETMLVQALNTVLSWIPLALLFVIFGRAPRIATVWVPLFMLIEVLFAAGVTLAISSLIIQIRDLQQVLPIIISLGIFLTPVIWPFSKIPAHYHLWGGTSSTATGSGASRSTCRWSTASSTRWDRSSPACARPCCSATIRAGRRSPPPRSARCCYLVFGYRIFKRFEVNFADIA